MFYTIMKKLMLLMMFLCLASVSAMAQDIIVKKDGTTIKAKVEKVTDSVIEYKRFSNLTGPTYTIKIADLLAINYENGESETFSNSGTSTVANEPLANTGERRLTDAQLLELSRLKPAKPEKIEKSKKIYTSEELYKKGKKMKIAGLCVGGAMIIGGTLMTCLSFNLVREGYVNGMYYQELYNDEATLLSGICVLGTGIALGGSLIWVGQHKMNKAKAIQSTALYQFDIPLNSNAKLTADVNLIKDNLTRQYAPGLGFHINF